MQPRDEILTALANTRAKLGATTLVAIDGPSGAGKTTLALELQECLDDAHIIHMDDLYAGWDEALNDDLYQRIESQIITPLLESNSARYQHFNWHSYKFEDWKELSIPRYLILEGVGSAANAIRPWISLSVFLEVSDDIGLDRVRMRDGKDIAAHIPQWQVMQRHHFEIHGTKAFSDLVFVNNPKVL